MGPDTEDLRPPLSLPRPRRAALLLSLLLALFCVTGSAAALPSPAGASAAPAAAGTSMAPPPEGEWTLPTTTGSPQVVRPYAQPPAPWAAGHRGVDLGLGPEGAVRAPAAGTVSFAGVVVDRPVLSIRHGAGYVSSFEPVETDLQVGDAVSIGETVGTIAASAGSHCDAPCLHWGVRLHGEYINPLLLLGDLEPSFLLPLDGDG